MKKFSLNELSIELGSKPPIAKYLNKFSIDNWRVEISHAKSYDVITVVPLIAEYDNLPILLTSIKQNEFDDSFNTLILFVVNNSKTETVKVKEDNIQSLDILRKKARETTHFDIGLIDASTDSFAIHDKLAGVGIARKIGSDFAIVFAKDLKNSIITFLDADCLISPNYFRSAFLSSKKHELSWGYFYFEHRRNENPILDDAITAYEIFLRYYVLALRFAGSNYAFHTVGSTLFFSPNAYIKIGGMNKRQAGEDFYFTQKLAKEYSYHEIKTATVFPDSRQSWRVPFGTGKAIGTMVSESKINYSLYDVESFLVLKKWLTLFEEYEFGAVSELIEQAAEINPHLKYFLDSYNFGDSFQKIISNSTSAFQLSKQKKIWFDGFKTFRLIHHLRDTAFPNKAMFKMVDRLFELSGINEDFEREGLVPDKDSQLKYLELLRQHA